VTRTEWPTARITLDSIGMAEVNARSPSHLSILENVLLPANQPEIGHKQIIFWKHSIWLSNLINYIRNFQFKYHLAYRLVTKFCNIIQSDHFLTLVSAINRLAHERWTRRPFWEWPSSGTFRPILTVMVSIFRVRIAESIALITFKIGRVVPELGHFQSGCLVQFLMRHPVLRLERRYSDN